MQGCKGEGKGAKRVEVHVVYLFFFYYKYIFVFQFADGHQCIRRNEIMQGSQHAFNI